MTRRAILYARVSSDEQAEHGYSLQSQVDAMREYAHRNGLQIAEELKEDYSGAKLQRPELERARELIEQGQVDAIVVYASDRLARNLAHSLLLREEWRRAGVELHTVSRGMSQDNPESRLTDNIEGVIAEFEREKIRERTSRGRNSKAKSGKWVGSGQAPYGYTTVGVREDAHLVINDAEAAVVQRIFQLDLGDFDNPPVPMRAIAELLTAEGVPPPRRNSKPGLGWYQSTVDLIIRRAAYVGRFKYGTYPIHLPDLAIIDPQTWTDTETRRQRNKDTSPRCKKYHYLLGGRVRCSCGVMMRGKTKTHRWRDEPGRVSRYSSYTCVAKATYLHLTACRERQLIVGLADAKVWEWLFALLSDPVRLGQGLDAMIAEQKRLNTPKRKRLQTLDSMIAKDERRLNRLAGDLAEIDGRAARGAIKAQMQTISKQRDSLEREQVLLTAELAQGELTPAQRSTILSMARQVRGRLDAATFEQKRELFDLLDLRVQLRNDEAGRWLDVVCILPDYVGALDTSAT